jgi:shikimate dehydrogenase
MTSHAIPLAGVFGWPAAHSLSPLLHSHWLEMAGIQGHYVPLECAPQDLHAALPALLKTGFRGFNVTVPHKEAVFHLADHVTARARDIGAINTLWMEDDGLHGDITDGDGFLQSVPKGTDLSHSVMVGAGGAAKAIGYTLCQTQKVKSLTILNRTRARAEDLASQLRGFFPDVSLRANTLDAADRPLASASLLINTTSLGMAGQPPLWLDLTPCPRSAVVYDIVYTPARTPLMELAHQRGLTHCNGLSMLINQGRPGFERWFGVPAPHTGAERALLQSVLDGGQ